MVPPDERKVPAKKKPVKKTPVIHVPVVEQHQTLYALAVKVFTWNNAIRVSGLAGIGYQTIANNADRPTLLLLFGAMIGLPSFLPNGKDKEP